MISWRARQALFIGMAVFVAVVQGPTSPTWLWNVTPFAASYLLLDEAWHRGTLSAAIALAVGIRLVTRRPPTASAPLAPRLQDS